MRELAELVAKALGCAVRQVEAVAGGDINRAFRVQLDAGNEVFVKTNDHAPAHLFHLEAQGLNWLAETRAIRVPRVLAVIEQPRAALILEYIQPASGERAPGEELGRRLAALHSSSAPSFGALPDNYIGTLSQGNDCTQTWADFWVERRLEPQFQLALKTGNVPGNWARDSSAVYRVVRDLVQEPAQPERIHGDLWNGNVLTDTTGNPVLVDPAAYAGHGEVDLAMMQLFGGFGERVFAAYWEARGGAAGWRERLPIYQLYPLLVHVNLFGGAYVPAVSAILRRWVGQRGAR